MGKSTVVFAGRNGLDALDLRVAVLRIPEVSVRIREAQKIIDEQGTTGLDLHNFIGSDDETFLRNIKLKSLAAAIVQIGLFDRHRKYQSEPDFLIGNSNGDSALQVITKKMSMRELIEKSQAALTFRPLLHLVSQDMPTAPLLSGVSLEEYDVVRVRKDVDTVPLRFEVIVASSMDVKRVLTQMHQQDNVTQFVNIGPLNSLLDAELRATSLGDAEILDSIDMDPMLNWFWRNMRPMRTALAQ